MTLLVLQIVKVISYELLIRLTLLLFSQINEQLKVRQLFQDQLMFHLAAQHIAFHLKTQDTFYDWF